MVIPGCGEPMKRKPEQQETKGTWLTTFNDLVTLLLTFFVLVLTMSSLDEAKVKEMSRSIIGAMGRLEAGSASEFRIFEPFVTPMGRITLSLVRKKETLADKLGQAGDFETLIVDEGVLVTMDERLFFDSGNADIRDAGKAVLHSLARILKDTEGDIRVAGHTDDVPISTEIYPTNWELSVARATRVVRYLVAESGIQPERLSASGYADSRPRVPGTDADARAANRRVEIVITVAG